jgi:hypothetical protein
MSPRQPRLPAMVLAELEGLPWSLERGSKHWQIRIGGDLVAIYPFSASARYGSSRSMLATRSNIRRWKQNKENAA